MNHEKLIELMKGIQALKGVTPGSVYAQVTVYQGKDCLGVFFSAKNANHCMWLTNPELKRTAKALIENCRTFIRKYKPA